MKDFAIKKLYYSISEVSKMTSIKPYVLRYWESEFPELKPSKNRAGKRIYRNNDIKTVLLIKKLLYMDRFTIEGAKQRIKELYDQDDHDQHDSAPDNKKRQDILNDIRRGLHDIIRMIDT
ncbi:MAG: MerR family transcriptional regulator [bacterium]